jgi:putative DNA primase/helicase
MDTDSDRIIAALSFISPDDRDTWIRIGMAIKTEQGEAGFDLWDGWSQQSSCYEPKVAQSCWKSFRSDGRVTVGTLFHVAKENGWIDDGKHQKSTPAEIADRRRLAAERLQKEEAAIAHERAETAAKAGLILKAATEAKADHPYLVRKQVLSLPTLREIEANRVAEILGYAPKSGGELLTGRLLAVPVKQGDGISTLELIDGDGHKTALMGRGTKIGGYWATERLPDGDGSGLTLLIGEGVATVATVTVNTKHPGVASLSSGNLVPVAKAMRERFPAANLVILADLGKLTGQPDPHAIEAAQAVGGNVAIPDFGPDRDSESTDFNDLALKCGPEAVERAISGASPPVIPEPQSGRESAPEGHSRGWPEPQPLIAKVAPEPYPLDVLPQIIREAVEEVANFVKAPISMVGSSALAAISLACQAHVDVKRAEKLEGPVGVFILVIADSGERKSTCDTFFTRAIREYEEGQAEAAKPILQDHKAAFSAWEAERDGIISAIKQAGKMAKPVNGKDLKTLKAELNEHQHAEPEPPRFPRLLYSDVTPESLAFELAKKWPSGGVVSAEGGSVLGSHGMGRESVMRNLGLLNQLWDGASFSIDRRSTESFKVRGARLTIHLQVQEPTLREFLSRSGALARGTGFLARFLVVWPASTQGRRPFTEAPASWPALAAYNRRIAEILEQPAPVDEEGALTPALLSLSPEAKAAWVSFHDAIEGQLASGGDLYDVRDVAAKTADNAVRLAALFQQFEHGMGGAVGLDSFAQASRIAAWHLNESFRFFSELALPVELADAARLNSWLIDYCQREGTNIVPNREAQRLGPIREKERLTTALRELEGLDRVKVAHEGRRKIIKVNPALVGVAP